MKKPTTKTRQTKAPRATKRVAKPKATTSKSDDMTVKPFIFRSSDSRYMGDEPTWEEQPTEKNRLSQMARAFTWYNYYFANKEAKEMLLQWFKIKKRDKDYKIAKSIADSEYPLTYCWLSRMTLLGLELTKEEQELFDSNISALLESKISIKAEDNPVEEKKTIQDHLRDKIIDCASEIDAMFDDFRKSGAKMTTDIKPIATFRSMNVAPQLIGYISDIWQKELAEYKQVIEGTDKELVEAYNAYNKIQMKNFVKFAEQVITDCASYIQVKKSEKKPRAKKAISPEKLVAKFKYLKEFVELKLKSESPSKLIASSEVWLYDTEKRKLIRVVADLNVGSLTVKGSSIVGYDEKESVQKILRKPADQLKEVFANGRPATRKAFKEIKATETKFNGRSNDNLIILKVW